jgi:hypothetical protein
MCPILIWQGGPKHWPAFFCVLPLGKTLESRHLYYFRLSIPRCCITITGQGYFQSLTNASLYKESWATQDVTVSELPYRFETEGAISVKGVAVRLFKQPSPAPYGNFLQLVGIMEI